MLSREEGRYQPGSSLEMKIFSSQQHYGTQVLLEQQGNVVVLLNCKASFTPENVRTGKLTKTQRSLLVLTVSENGAE